MKSRIIFIITAVLCLGAASAHADDICPDRPAKAIAPCTVNPSTFQIETDIINITSQRSSTSSTTTILAPNPTLKYGLTTHSDIEFSIGNETINSKSAGLNASASGMSDLYVRLKYNVLDNPKFQITISPWIKIPTADDELGNGALEGGVSVPVQYIVNDKWTITYVQEVDSLRNSITSGYHINTAETISASRALPNNLSASFELWSDYNNDPLQRQQQYSADTAISWVNNNLEYDIGVNFGLNKNTPQTQVYIGFSRRF